MPVYNTENYVETAILSVLMQTYKNFELICIDDCSTDSSLEILEHFSTLDSRIRIIKNKTNMGLSYNRNLGVCISKGDYILFLDSDDWLSFNTLEILYSVAKPNNLEILMFKFITYWEDSNTFSIEPFYDMEFLNKYAEKLFNHYDLDDPNYLFEIPGAACNKLYSKDFLVKTGFKFPEGLIFEDTAIFFQNMINAKRVSLVNEYLYNRRRRKNSITTYSGEKILDIIQISKDLIEIFLQNNKIYNRYKSGALNILFAILRGKYDLIDDEFKEEFVQKSNSLIKELDEEYGLIKDIILNLDYNNMKFFNRIWENKTDLYICDLDNFKVYFEEKLVISDMKFTEEFANVFIKNKSNYDSHKKHFLIFIFEKLKEKCIYCEDSQKEKIFQQCKFLVNKLYSEYALYEDIKKYINDELLNFFNQDYI